MATVVVEAYRLHEACKEADRQLQIITAFKMYEVVRDGVEAYNDKFLNKKRQRTITPEAWIAREVQLQKQEMFHRNRHAWAKNFYQDEFDRVRQLNSATRVAKMVTLTDDDVRFLGRWVNLDRFFGSEQPYR